MYRTTQSGLTLIEVLVTMFIMTIGLLGLAGLQSTSVKEGLDTATRSQVMWLVTELVERMRANPGGLANGYTTAAGAANVCAAAPARRCSANTAGPAEATCSPNEMAAFDVWEVFCGLETAGVMANSTDPLMLTDVTITCDAGAAICTPRSNFTVSISWTSQAVDNSKLLSDAAKDAQLTDSITMVVRP